VEEAGVHSGDSACALPPVSLAPDTVVEIEEIVRRLADELGVVGLINVQLAIRGKEIYVLEANPRASRTVPFVAKATGIPLAKLAARVSVGQTLAELRAQGVYRVRRLEHHAVKEAVLPFVRFPRADTVLGPEMRSTGEVMGVDRSFARAFAKSQIAAGNPLPDAGMVLVSLADRDKAAGLPVARRLVELGFEIAATSGTAGFLRANGVPIVLMVDKVFEEDPLVVGTPQEGTVDAVWLLRSRRVSLVINTPQGVGPRMDGYRIRLAAQQVGVPCITTIAAARAATEAIAAGREGPLEVRSLQEYHA
jgi:carbamoyl-phosphate synthase large subunit